MENLNAEQIKKALECCQKRKCQSCTYDVFGNPLSNCRVKKHALALIKSQEQEIANLNASCTEIAQCCTKLETLYKIECKRVDTVKADTVRKMQEMLEAHFDSDSDYFRSSHGYIRSVVDQIANELLTEDAKNERTTT